MGKDAYCQVTRQMVEDMKKDIVEIKEGQKDLSSKITDLFNHQSNRWPPAAAWALGIIGTVLGGVVTAAALKLFL